MHWPSRCFVSGQKIFWFLFCLTSCCQLHYSSATSQNLFELLVLKCVVKTLSIRIDNVLLAVSIFGLHNEEQLSSALPSKCLDCVGVHLNNEQLGSVIINLLH